MNKELKKIAEITLNLLSKKSWKILSLKEVKQKTKVELFDELIKNKQELLNNINSYFDYALSLQVINLEDSDHKDMLFEILMMRFDILQNNRNAILSIFTSFKHKPKELIFLLPQLLNSIVLIIGYAKISSKGIIGQIKIKVILIIYISTFLVWIKDKNSSLEKTMTALDSYLDNAVKIFKFIK